MNDGIRIYFDTNACYISAASLDEYYNTLYLDTAYFVIYLTIIFEYS